MALPRGWLLTYTTMNNDYQAQSIRGICPHCENATTFLPCAIFQVPDQAQRIIHLILTCSYVPCRKVVYVCTRIQFGRLSSLQSDEFYMYPSGAIDKPHPGIPRNIADDWIEAQKSMQVSAPKATAVMLRRVLYSVLIDKGCKLHPIKDGLEQLITNERLPKIFDEWLPAIKDDGHDGAHPDRALQVSTENVNETIEYTSELLRYLYIEPYEFAQRKARNATPPSGTP